MMFRAECEYCGNSHGLIGCQSYENEVPSEVARQLSTQGLVSNSTYVPYRNQRMQIALVSWDNDDGVNSEVYPTEGTSQRKSSMNINHYDALSYNRFFYRYNQELPYTIGHVPIVPSLEPEYQRPTSNNASATTTKSSDSFFNFVLNLKLHTPFEGYY